MAFELVTANERFVHKRTANRGGNGLPWNTDCHCQPRYYGPKSLRVVTEAEAENMHRCRKCFPKPKTPSIPLVGPGLKPLP